MQKSLGDYRELKIFILPFKMGFRPKFCILDKDLPTKGKCSDNFWTAQNLEGQYNFTLAVVAPCDDATKRN